MTVSTPTTTNGARERHEDTAVRRLSTETKSAFKTTELIVYVLSVLGVLIAALVTDQEPDGSAFSAKTAWLYVTLLTIGYMVSRGLAKSGSREKFDA